MGGLVGLVSGAAMALWAASYNQAKKLEEISRIYISAADEIAAETRSVLSNINNTVSKECSDKDVFLLRSIVMNARFVKATSRLINETSRCNSVVGHSQIGSELPPADLMTADGLSFWLKATLPNVPGTYGLVVGQGQALAVLSVDSYSWLGDPTIDYSLLIEGADKNKLLLATSDPDLLEKRIDNYQEPEIDEQFFTTGCMNELNACLVARLKPDKNYPPLLLLTFFSFTGMLTGVAFGYAIAMARARRWSLGNRLLRAMRNDQISTVFQPIVSLDDNEVVGVEVLARWNTVEGVAISPSLFVSAAEQDGITGELTRYIVQQAISQLAETLCMRNNLYVSINITAEELVDQAFYTYMDTICNGFNLPKSQIILEITERKKIRNNKIRKMIKKFRSSGYRIYIDDFGVEYSNISYLLDLDIDGVKLDASFTKNIETDNRAKILASEIMSMAQKLDLDVVIEGIETPQQADYFRNLVGGLRGQGWHFGKPMSAKQLVGFIGP